MLINSSVPSDLVIIVCGTKPGYGEIFHSAKEDTFLSEELLQPGLSLKSQPLHKCKTTRHSTPPE